MTALPERTDDIIEQLFKGHEAVLSKLFTPLEFERGTARAAIRASTTALSRADLLRKDVRVQDGKKGGFRAAATELFPDEWLAEHMDWSSDDIAKGVGGPVVNLGKSGALSAALLLLAYLPPLQQVIQQHPHQCNVASRNAFCAMCELEKTLPKLLRNKITEKLSPEELFRRLRSLSSHLRSNRFNDVHEVLRALLTQANESSLPREYARLDQSTRAKVSARMLETSRFGRLFGGYTVRELRCVKCRAERSVYDHFAELLLPVSKRAPNVAAALKQLFAKRESFKLQCAQCDSLQETESASRVFHPPRVLLVSLKRWQQGRDGLSKLSKHVAFDEQLDLGAFLSDDNAAMLQHKQSKAAWRQSDVPMRYRLHCVVAHTGSSHESGEYEVFARAPDGVFYAFDTVKAQVTRAKWSRVQRSCAYMLAYIRVDESRAPGAQVFLRAEEDKSRADAVDTKRDANAEAALMRIFGTTENKWKQRREKQEAKKKREEEQRRRGVDESGFKLPLSLQRLQEKARLQQRQQEQHLQEDQKSLMTQKATLSATAAVTSFATRAPRIFTEAIAAQSAVQMPSLSHALLPGQDADQDGDSDHGDDRSDSADGDTADGDTADGDTADSASTAVVAPAAKRRRLYGERAARQQRELTREEARSATGVVADSWFNNDKDSGNDKDSRVRHTKRERIGTKLDWYDRQLDEGRVAKKGRKKQALTSSDMFQTQHEKNRTVTPAQRGRESRGRGRGRGRGFGRGRGRGFGRGRGRGFGRGGRGRGGFGRGRGRGRGRGGRGRGFGGRGRGRGRSTS
ncbi:MAG: hypothetical protein MHM6MM_003828 [Cercozoa sp. M6MM]